MRTKTIILLVCCFTLASFKLLSQPDDNWKGYVELKNGVKHIYNPEDGLWDKENSKKISFEKIMSIGNVDSKENYIFSWVKDIATDKTGKIYVCDSGTNRIRVYDRNGNYIMSIGKRGKGPERFFATYRGDC